MTSDIETAINGQPGVVTTVATVGQGSMRFILTYSGQRQYSNYAQIMVRMDDQRSIAALTQHVDRYIARNYPQVNASTKRVMFGPSGDSAIEVRIKGPDPDRQTAPDRQPGWRYPLRRPGHRWRSQRLAKPQ